MKSRPRYLSVANEYFMDKTNDALLEFRTRLRSDCGCAMRDVM